jgi:hypothetical protein
MALSPKMSSYIKTGRCPHCNAVLLTDEYVRLDASALEQAAIRIGQGLYDQSLVTGILGRRTQREADEELLSGPARKAMLIRTAPNGVPDVQCQVCMQKWRINALLLIKGRDISGPLGVKLAADRLAQAPNTPSGRVAGSIDLSGCRVTGLLERRSVEMPWGAEERKTYSNRTTGSSMTKEVTISKELTRTVTVESDKLKAHNAGASVNIVGFAAIQGQVQDQIGERYSVASQATFTKSGTTRFEIPPGTSVVHVIHWVATCKTGLAILGRPSDPTYSRLAEVPYILPWDLDYSDEIQ